MATFRFVGRDINIHWNGYDIVGPAGTVFSIPDQLYEEFESDLRGAEPTLEWIDTNEFLTLTNAVSVTTLQSTFPISVTTTTSGKIIGVTSSSAADGYVLTSDGSGGVAWEALPADATGITSIIGTSPISAAVAATQATISIDQSLITGAAAATNAQTVRTYVKNTTGSSIAKGSAVYVSGATGDNALIALSTASTEVGSSKTLGITSEAIANDAFGYVVESGYITGIDTSGVTAGTQIWLGTTPGSLVYGSPPAEPNHSVYLGVVIREQQNNGSILVKVQNGYELNELHDVFTNGVSTSLPLVYSSTSSGWIASALTSVGISDNAIVSSKIASGSVTSGHIAASAVGSAALATGAVVAAKIATGAVTSGHISTGAVGSAALAASSVVSAAIAASAVTSGHIAAGAVGSAAIASGSINSTHIGANAVVAGDIAANAVTSGNIAAGAVNTAKIDSTGGSANWVLTANGSGGATFAAPIISVNATTLTGSGTWVIPTGVQYLRAALLMKGGDGGDSGRARVGNASGNASNGGASGGGGSGTYYTNIYVGDVTSMTFSVGAGGAGGAAVSAIKANANSVAVNTGGLAGSTGVHSTLGAYLSSNNSVNIGYESVYQFEGGATLSGAADGASAGVSGTSQADNVDILNMTGTVICDREDLRSIGLFVATTYPAGNAGGNGAATSSISGSLYTGAGGAAGDAGYYAVQSGGGGAAGGTTTAATAGGAGYRGGSGGGGGALSYRTTADAVATVTATAGAGGNGVAGTGCGGGGGGGAAIINTNSTGFTNTNATATSGKGGDGGSGTIIIWW